MTTNPPSRGQRAASAIVPYLQWLRERMARGALPQSRSRGKNYADPLHAGRHPFQTYLLSLCVVSSVPLIVGEARPNSIDATLPDPVATAWGIMLFVGAVTALFGSYWLWDYANALTIERIGLLFAGAPAVIYGLAIAAVAGWGGAVTSALTLGFGFACLRRSRDIAKIIHTAIKATAP